MNTKKLTTMTFATEDAFDDDDFILISITTRPMFSHRIMEWRNDGSYSKAWNMIADKICDKNNDIECTIDDNYLRIFYTTVKERNLIYSTIDEIKDEIDDCFI